MDNNNHNEGSSPYSIGAADDILFDGIDTIQRNENPPADDDYDADGDLNNNNNIVRSSGDAVRDDGIRISRGGKLFYYCVCIWLVIIHICLYDFINLCNSTKP